MSLTKVTYSMINGSPANVLDFGAVGDGVTDDTAAFNAALAASKEVYVPEPSVSYKLTSLVTIPVNTSLFGENKQTTKLLHAYNGTMFELLDGASIRGLYLEGQGATYTGGGLYFSGTNGRQLVQSCKIINFDGPCAYFEVAAGSQSTFIDVEAYRVNAGTGTARVAFEIISTQQLSAVPRKFLNIETNGQCAFNFGGCNNTYVSDSFLGDLIYTAESRGVLITGCRIANQLSLVIDGNNNTIVGCNISPQITIAADSDADNIALQGNSYNRLPIIDNSGNSRNLIDVFGQEYTPVLTSGGTAPSLGNGTITGSFTRQGATTFIIGELTLGSTTSLGTGGLSISLPQRRWGGDIFCGGTVVMNRGGTLYTGTLQIAGSVTTASLIRDTSGSITFNSPAVFAAGDTIRWSAIYSN
jgi:hypothetical protein